jgi:hypothetical protein
MLLLVSAGVVHVYGISIALVNYTENYVLLFYLL